MPIDPDRLNPLAVGVHVRAAGRPERETERLLDYLMASTWPGGVSDRSEPVARGWLRLWGPARVVVDAPQCGCHRGRCLICN